MVHSLGRGLALLHSIPSETCPFDEMPITRLQRAKKAVDSGLVDITQFDERNVRLTPRRIYDRLIRNIPTRNQTVVAHGDATLSNILVCPSGEVGFIDCGNSGRSDPYLDLAILKEDLLTCFGTDAAQRFLRRMGFANGMNSATISSGIYTNCFEDANVTCRRRCSSWTSTVSAAEDDWPRMAHYVAPACLPACGDGNHKCQNDPRSRSLLRGQFVWGSFLAPRSLL